MSCFVPKQPHSARFLGVIVIACNAESISSSSVNGRFSETAFAIGISWGGFGFGLPKSEVNFPGPFLRCAGFEVIRRTLEGDGVREVSVDDNPREAEGESGIGVWRWVCGDGFGVRLSLSCLRKVSTWGDEPRRLRQ